MKRDIFDESDLVNLREQIQDDLICILDGQDELISHACQVVVDRINGLIHTNAGWNSI